MAGKATVSAKITADTKNWNVHMAQAAKAADNVRKSSARLDKQNSAIARSFQRAAAGASVLHGPLNGVSGRLNAIATAMRLTNVGLVALGGAFTALGVGITAGVRSLDEFEVSMKRVNAVQEATGHSAGLTAEGIHDIAQEIAMSTLASVDGVMAAAAALGTFGSVAGDNFEKTLMLAQDVAEVMGTDMQGATVQLAKALENPEQGLTALTRAGVTFTEGTKSQIEAAMEFGDILKAQGLILDQVEKQLGGVGAAVADDTLIGGWDSLTQHIQTFLRNSEAVAWALERIKSSLGWLNDQFAQYNDNRLERAWADAEKAGMEYEALQQRMEKGQARRAGARLQYLKEEARLTLENAEKLSAEVGRENEAAERARQKGKRKQQQLADDAALAAAKEYGARHLKISNYYARERENAEKRANTKKWDDQDPAGSSNRALEADQHRLAARIAANDAYYSKVAESEKLHGDKLIEWSAERDALNEAAVQEHTNRVLDIKKRAFDDAQKLIQKEIDLDKERAENEEAARKANLASLTEMGTAISATMTTISGMYQEGSKQARAFAVVAQSAALMVTVANVAEGISKAFSNAGTVYMQAAAVAQATALGAQIIAMATNARGSRAIGGPTEPGTYWVGEQGPELVHFNKPAHVTRADESMGGVTVNLIEDASRAGQSSVDEAGIVQIAVASIRGELQRDIASGRGIFRQAEQQYGLNRTR